MVSRVAPSIYHGTFVHCDTPATLSQRQGYLCVNYEGVIRAFVPEDDLPVGELGGICDQLGWDLGLVQVFETDDNEFFFPGFIDTHIHAPQYPNAGIFGKTTLLDWLKTYTFPMEASLADVEKARRVYSTCVDRTLANGTTTASYYATIHVASTNVLASICKAKGQRALIGRVCMDSQSTLTEYYHDEPHPKAIEATKAVISHIESLDPHGHHIVPILTPRSCISCTGPFLQELADLSEAHNYRVQTHLSENKDEIKLVHKVWPNSKSYTHIYDEMGLLTERSILAHAIHLSQEEQELIAQHKAKISHCPTSNSALGSGICPVRTLLDAGITVGLGTDISGGYSPSLLEVVRHAVLVSRLLAQSKEDDHLKLTFEEALWLATRGGAELVGWKDKLGAFEVGMQWDAQLIRLHKVPDENKQNTVDSESNVQIFGWESQEDRIAKWVFGGDDRNTRMVWVGGRLVHSKSEP